MSILLEVLAEKKPFTLLWILALTPIGFIYISVIVPISLLLYAVLASFTGATLPALNILERLDSAIAASIYKVDALSLIISWNYVLFKTCIKSLELIIALLFASYIFTILHLYFIKNITEFAIISIKNIPLFGKIFKILISSPLRIIESFYKNSYKHSDEIEKELRFKIEMAYPNKNRMYEIYEGASFSLEITIGLYVILIIFLALLSIATFAFLARAFLLKILNIILFCRDVSLNIRYVNISAMFSNLIILIISFTSFASLRRFKKYLNERRNKIVELIREYLNESSIPRRKAKRPPITHPVHVCS